MNRTILLAVALLVVMSAMGCSDEKGDDMTSSELSNWIGKNVRIQFRRDALGAAASLPIPATTDDINGASTAVVGPLVKVNAKSIVIGDHQRQSSPKWIPREVILFVQLNP